MAEFNLRSAEKRFGGKVAFPRHLCDDQSESLLALRSKFANQGLSHQVATTPRLENPARPQRGGKREEKRQNKEGAPPRAPTKAQAPRPGQWRRRGGEISMNAFAQAATKSQVLEKCSRRASLPALAMLTLRLKMKIKSGVTSCKRVHWVWWRMMLDVSAPPRLNRPIVGTTLAKRAKTTSKKTPPQA